jgi:hypothetical protein
MIVFRDSADAAKIVKLPILRIPRVLLHCCHHAGARGVRGRFRASTTRFQRFLPSDRVRAIIWRIS